MNYKKEAIIRSIKILDIGFITAIYFSFGLFLAKACDDVAGEFDEEKETKNHFGKLL
jgi:hypothetical protein